MDNEKWKIMSLLARIRTFSGTNEHQKPRTRGAGLLDNGATE